MKIMHIASFQGNCGDILSHSGFYNLLKKILPNENIDVTQIEMRDFYRNSQLRKFDSTFLNEVNTYDLLVIGGGGFFDVQFDTQSGATMDMGFDFINGVKIPVWINSIGYHELTENEELYNKFYNWISYIKTEPNWFISLRNDGSEQRFNKRFNVNDYFLTVPDNAFWYERKSPEKKENDKNKRIGLILTNDLFSSGYNHIDKDEVNMIFRQIINELLNKNYDITFFLHTPQDFFLLPDLCKEISNENLRKHVVVSPYISSIKNSISRIEPYYNECDLIVSMRFHGCVLGLLNSIPVLALAGHTQIEDFMTVNGLGENCVIVNDELSNEKLLKKVQLMLAHSNEIVEKQNYIIDQMQSSGLKVIETIMDEIKKL